MFHRYAVFYDGCYMGDVMALSEASAFDKGCVLARVSASRYSGPARRLVSVSRCF